MKPLAEKLGRDATTVSRQIAQLEKLGLALAAGAAMGNDVSGLRFDPAMAALVSTAGAALLQFLFGDMK